MSQESILLPNLTYDCDISEEGVEEYYSIDDVSLNDLETVVKEYIEADCYAVVLDGEILYNNYNNDLSHREKILEYCIREQLIDNTHRHIFVPMLRKGSDFMIEIYMFDYPNAWKIVIEFNHVTREFKVSKKI